MKYSGNFSLNILHICTKGYKHHVHSSFYSGVTNSVVGRVQPSRLNALLEYLPVLIEYLDLFQSQRQGMKTFGTKTDPAKTGAAKLLLLALYELGSMRISTLHYH